MSGAADVTANTPLELVIVTGVSGAGKSIALRTLEDLGFEAIDNLPLGLLSKIILPSTALVKKIAVVCDVRSRGFSEVEFRQCISVLQKRRGLQLHVIYLDCENQALQRRFTETRRKHPLASDRPVMDGIEHERSLLGDLRYVADIYIDTTDFKAGDLRQQIVQHLEKGDQHFHLSLTSFAYRNGIPREADLVLDVRFLQNPFYVPELKSLTGRDAPVADYIRRDPHYAEFLEKAEQLITPLLPLYRKEGKHYLTLAIGCTGGQHRSVFVTEELAKYLRDEGYPVTVRHRELNA
jgi:UPF0042 nucleotide-binding protein